MRRGEHNLRRADLLESCCRGEDSKGIGGEAFFSDGAESKVFCYAYTSQKKREGDVFPPTDSVNLLDNTNPHPARPLSITAYPHSKVPVSPALISVSGWLS